MCRQLNIVRAAYYKWLHWEIPAQEQENMLLAQLIQDYDDRFNRILGYRRMTMYINRLNNKHYSKNRVHRVMKAEYPFCDSPEAEEIPNLQSRNDRREYSKLEFLRQGSQREVATDVTEFKWYEGPVVHKPT